MNYLSIIKASCVDFNGWSTVLQVAGCSHCCEGCFNPSSWKYNAGVEFTENTYRELMSYLSKPYIKNLVIQGGDPLFNKNIDSVLDLCSRVKSELPDRNIVVFTGYTLLEIQSSSKLSPILDYIDYLVDGRFDINLKVRDKFFGSSNQKIYHIIDGVPVIDKSLN